MGLNLSDAQTAQELGSSPDDAQRMTGQLRDGIVARQPEPTLSGEVECDEVYVVVAGHKGHPEAVKKKAATGYDQSQADPGEFRASKRGDLSIIRIGRERYEIPDSVIFGG